MKQLLPVAMNYDMLCVYNMCFNYIAKNLREETFFRTYFAQMT